MKTERLKPFIRVPFSEAEMTTLRMILADQEILDQFLDKLPSEDRHWRNWDLINIRDTATVEYETWRGYPVSKGVR